jgi:tetratricopeptide (TPR) repeat protein
MIHRSVISVALTLLISATVSAQSTWSGHTNAGEYAFARGDVARAEAEFQAALDIAQGFPAGDHRLETSLENLARLYEHQSDFDRAQPLYQLLLAAREHRLGAKDPTLLDPLFAVARVSQPQGDLPTVVESLERYVAIAEASGEADPRKHWQVLQMLARMETIQERPERALEWQRKAREVITEDPSATSEERVVVLESLAEMELMAGNGPAAEQIYLEVSELEAEESEEAGAVPQTMARGAETALAAGELETAERLAKRALENSPDAEAELQARKALAELSWIRVNRGTEDMANLLAAADDNEDLVTARDRLQSLDALESGTDPTTLSRLAQIEALRGQPAPAAEWQRQYLEALPTGSEAEAGARVNLATLLGAAGQWNEALDENALLLAEFEAEYGPSDRRLMPVLGQRLELLEGAGQKKEAKKVRKRMKKISR